MKEWNPPTGFIETSSSVEGIRVYAPKPLSDNSPSSLTYKCPQCGASTMYEPSSKGITCPYCGYVQPILAHVPGKQAAKFEFTTELMSSPIAYGWGKDRHTLSCEACGAEISVGSDDLSTTCPFCASNRVQQKSADSNLLQPSHLIPFKISPKNCQALARQWLSKGWMHPSDLTSTATGTSFRGIYSPYWTFSAVLDSTWRAEVGIPRTERYYDAGSKDWKTRTVIDWHWRSGKTQVNIQDLLEYATSRISVHLLHEIEPYNLNDLTSFEPGFLAGWQAKSYDIALETAWETARSQMREKAKKACYADISSAYVRNFSMTADFDNESWRYILLPIFISAYRYNDKIYQILINGQTGKVTGQKPVVWWKVILAILAVLTPGTLLILIGIPLIALGGLGAILSIIGGVLLIAGIIVSIIFLNQAIQAGRS